jgi:hypothetical protein
VSADDNVELGSRRIEVKLLNVVQDVYQNRSTFGDCRHRQLGGPRAFVNVASNSHDRRHVAQLLEDPRLANITCMDD